MAYLVARAVFRAVGRLLFDIRISGLEHLPADRDGQPVGPWICCGLPHRTWIEPLAVVAFMPPQPRLVMLADGSVMFRSAWRRLLIRRVGGVVPIWPGSGAAGFIEHTAAAQTVIGGGAVFALFPETGRPSPAPAFRRLSPGVAYFAIRTGAPIVAAIFGGTHDLYLRRRVEMRVLPPLQPPRPPPPAGSIAERTAAEALMTELRQLTEPAAAAAHAAAERAPGRRRLWRWLHGPYPRAD